MNKLNFLDDAYNDIDFLKLIKEQQSLIIFSSFDKFVFDALKAIEDNNVTKGQFSDKLFNYCNAHIPTLINEEIAINYSDYSDFVSVLDFEKLELDNYLKEVSDEKYEELMKECDWNNRFGQIMQVITEKGLV